MNAFFDQFMDASILNGLCTHRDDRTASRGRRMGRPADDILPGEQPVAPAETADVVERLEVQDGRLRILNGKIADAALFSPVSNIGEEFAMRTWPVGAELVEDFCQGSVRHGYLQEMVEEGNLEHRRLAQTCCFYTLFR